MRHALLTGFPGLLAAAWLPKLLTRDPHQHITCLVQPAYRQLAEQTLSAMRAEAIGDAGSRCVLVEGDITQPGLGLGGTHTDLFGHIDEVFHLAAVYDLAVDRDLGMAVNVAGTRNVLEVCRNAHHLQRLHYVSTCYVSGRWPGVFREQDLIGHQVFNNHYEATKFHAEVLVAAARDDGLPVTIYRPAVVGGDATTGATDKFDGPFYVLQWMARQRTVALLPVIGNPGIATFNAVPRDWVIDALDVLANQPDTVGLTLALADPQPLQVREILEVLAEHTPLPVLRARLPAGPTSAILRRSSALQRITGLPAEATAYFRHPTSYATDNAWPRLEAAGLALPDRRSWFAAMLRYATDHPHTRAHALH